MPVILDTQEAEIRIMVGNQLHRGQIVLKTLSRKRAGGVAQVAGPEFKPQYSEKKKKERKKVISIVGNTLYP
jgi:hypothetical protein